MINDEHFRNILHKLLEKSANNKVHWVRGVPGRMNYRDQKGFHVVFSDGSVIEVFHGSPESAPDYAGVGLVVNGNVVHRLHAEDGNPDYKFFRTLYDEAYRSVTGWDAALEQIAKELSSDEDVGSPASA